jgi:hypothetical protein
MYNLDDDLTVMSLITKAVAQLKGAALRRAYVSRGESQMPIDLYATMIEGKSQSRVDQLLNSSG